MALAAGGQQRTRQQLQKAVDRARAGSRACLPRSLPPPCHPLARAPRSRKTQPVGRVGPGHQPRQLEAHLARTRCCSVCPLATNCIVPLHAPITLEVGGRDKGTAISAIMRRSATAPCLGALAAGRRAPLCLHGVVKGHSEQSWLAAKSGNSSWRRQCKSWQQALASPREQRKLWQSNKVMTAECRITSNRQPMHGLGLAHLKLMPLQAGGGGACVVLNAWLAHACPPPSPRRPPPLLLPEPHPKL